MGQLYLIRHGQASFGEADYDKLSPTGWQQATQLSHWLHQQGIDFDAVYAGTLRRHRETAEAALQHRGGTRLQHDPAFDELNANLLWQLHLPEMLRQHGDLVISPDKAVLKRIFVQAVDD
ncbi:MAG TPA: phosphoglycerate mutase family protein, partial [Pseudomonadales bacterium]|nr:phosphoglycerate mutase family protein [Pseudomonadales bacterium]